LEGFKFEKIQEIRSVICQVACALALAEEKAQFEHRDLHLGNVLVKRLEDEEQLIHFEVGDAISFPADGVICSVIDYSLSRVSAPGEDQVLFRDLDCLPWLFEGDDTLDTQFSVYKEIKAAKGAERNWRDFCPKSNVLWMNFLLERLVLKQRNSKAKKPKKMFDELLGLARRICSYTSISQMILSDEFFIKYLSWQNK
jgi:serine/threonine-protein kinase haspin